MSKVQSKRPRDPKANQPDLPGVVPPEVKRARRLAEEWLTAKDAAREAGDQAKASRESLTVYMMEQNIPEIIVDDPTSNAPKPRRIKVTHSVKSEAYRLAKEKGDREHEATKAELQEQAS